MDQAILSHLQWLYQLKMFESDYLNNSQELEFWVSVSCDASKMVRSNHNTKSFLVAFNFQLLPELGKFEEDSFSFVHRNLHWILLNERENVVTLSHHSELILRQMTLLSHNTYLFQPDQTMVFNHKPTQISSPPETSQSGKIVKLKIAYWLGDSKFLQIFTGTPMSNSGDRCYLCTTAQIFWKDKDVPHSEPAEWKDLKNLFSGMGFIPPTTQTRREGRKPMLFVPFTSVDQVRRVLDEGDLWGMTFMADPLHIIENHSNQMKSFLETFLGKQKWLEVDALMSLFAGVEIPNNTKASVRAWRLIWGCCQNTWKKVIEDDEVYQLVWSWATIIRMMYLPVGQRTLCSFFQYFSVCLYHFTLWKKIVVLPNTQTKFLLGIHLLYPHTVEQFFEVSLCLTLTEGHEFSWASLRNLWKNCKHHKNPVRTLTERALFAEKETKPGGGSSVAGVLKKYTPHLTMSKIEIPMNWSKYQEIRKYLRSKGVPENWFSWNNSVLSLGLPSTHAITPLPDFSSFYQDKAKSRRAHFDRLTTQTKPMSVVIPLCPSPRSSPQTSPFESPSNSVGSSPDISPRLRPSSPRTPNSTPLRRSPRLTSPPPSPVSSRDDENVRGIRKSTHEHDEDDDENLINTSYLSPDFPSSPTVGQRSDTRVLPSIQPEIKRPKLSIQSEMVYSSCPLLLSSKAGTGKKRRVTSDLEDKPLGTNPAPPLNDEFDLGQEYLSQSLSNSQKSFTLDEEDGGYSPGSPERSTKPDQCLDLDEESICIAKKPVVIDLDHEFHAVPVVKKPKLGVLPPESLERVPLERIVKRRRPLSPQVPPDTPNPTVSASSVLNSELDGRLWELSLVAECSEIDKGTVISKLDSGGELTVNSFLNLLNDRVWLDDLCIDFFASFICAESVWGSCHWMSWAWMNSPHLDRVGRRKQERNDQGSALESSPRTIIAPVNWSNTHWGLVGYSVDLQDYWFFDATKTYMLSKNVIKRFHFCCEALFPALLPESPPEEISVRAWTPQTQKDGWSCGLRCLYFLCTCSESLLLPPDPPVSAMRIHLLERWVSSRSIWIHSSISSRHSQRHQVSLEKI